MRDICDERRKDLAIILHRYSSPSLKKSISAWFTRRSCEQQLRQLVVQPIWKPSLNNALSHLTNLNKVLTCREHTAITEQLYLNSVLFLVQPEKRASQNEEQKQGASEEQLQPFTPKMAQY